MNVFDILKAPIKSVTPLDTFGSFKPASIAPSITTPPVSKTSTISFLSKPISPAVTTGSTPKTSPLPQINTPNFVQNILSKPIITSTAQSTPAISTTGGFDPFKFISSAKDFFFKKQDIALQPAFTKPSEAVTVKGTKSEQILWDVFNRTPEFFVGLIPKIAAIVLPDQKAVLPFGMDAGRLSGIGGKEGETSLQTFGQDYLDNWAIADAKAGLTRENALNPSNPKSLLNGVISAGLNIIIPSLAVIDGGNWLKSTSRGLLTELEYKPTLKLKTNSVDGLSFDQAKNVVATRLEETLRSITSENPTWNQTAKQQASQAFQEAFELLSRNKTGAQSAANIFGEKLQNIAIALNEDISKYGKINYAPAPAGAEALPGYKSAEPRPQVFGQEISVGASIEKKIPVGFGENPPKVYKINNKTFNTLKEATTYQNELENANKQFMFDPSKRVDTTIQQVDVITDPSQVQEIRNSILEGQNLLSTGKNALGEPLTSKERVIIRNSILSAQAKIGEGLKTKDYSIQDVTPAGYGPESTPIIPKELQPLAEEAKKYKSVEEFRKAVNQAHLQDLSKPEVHNWGRAFASYPDEPLTDISQIIKDGNNPGSYLSTMKYSNPVEYKAITAPGNMITIYRAVPKNIGDTIRIGDYVALDKKYAQMHLDSVLQGEQKTPGKIISTKVPKKDIVWGEADFTEWVYSPQNLRQQFPTLTDFYNKVAGKLVETPKTPVQVNLKINGKSGPFYQVDTVDYGTLLALHGKKFADAVDAGTEVTVYRAGKEGEVLKDGTFLTADPKMAKSYTTQNTTGFGGPKVYTYKIPAKDLVSVDNLDYSELVYKKTTTDIEEVKKEVSQIQEASKKLPETYLIDTPERKALRLKIANSLYGDGVKNKNSRADIIIGLPASGKSTLGDELVKDHGSLVIDADKVKPLLPEYNKGKGAAQISREASRIAQRELINLAIKNGDNIVFPTLGRFKDKLKDMIDVLKAGGYNVHLHHIDVSLETARTRAAARFKKTNQITDFSIIDENTRLAIKDSYDTLQTHEAVKTKRQISGEAKEGALGSRTGEAGRQVRPSGSGGQRLDSLSESEKVGPPPEINYSTKADRFAAEKANEEFRLLEVKQAIKDAELAAWNYKDPTLEGLKVQRDALEEALRSNPARGLMKYVSGRTGRLPEVTGSQTMRSISGSNKIVQTSEFGLHGDQIVTERGYKDVNEAQAGVDKYIQDTERLKELNTEIRTKNQEVSVKRKEIRDEIILNRVSDKIAKQTEKLVAGRDTEKLHIKNLMAAEKISAEKIAKEQLQEIARKQAIEKAYNQSRKRTGLVGKFQRSLGPIGQTDPETIQIYKTWKGRLAVAKDLADDTYKQYANQDLNDFGEIIAYEAGKKTPWIKEAFDDIWTEGRRRGLHTAYIDDYITHVYSEKPEIVQKAIAKWLKDEGISQEVIDSYMSGEKELPESFAIRLKMKPYFIKKRTFPDYITAMKYGLTPRFMTVAEHLAYYREQMEKVLANKALIEDLFAKGKILDADSSPESWVEVKIPGQGRRQWYAPKDLADGLNGQFEVEGDMTLSQYFFKYASSGAKLLQDIKLSAGVPFTPINFFAIGQTNVQLTSFIGSILRGKTTLALTDIKAVYPFIRSFSDSASRAWLNSNEKFILMMERNGIDLGQRLGHYDELYKTFRSLYNLRNFGEIFKSVGRGIKVPFTVPVKLFKDKGWKALFGPDGRDAAIGILRDFKDSKGLELFSDMFSKAINSKTFNSLIPQQKVVVFKGVYEQALKSGMTDAEAQLFAAQTVKNSFGLIEDLGRSKQVKNIIGTFFFAPRYREAIVNMLYRSAKSVTNEARNNEYMRNRSFLIGSAVVFAIYQLINYQLNGDFTWNNESGREFSIKLPVSNGDILYFDYMPSTLAFPRNMASGTFALVRGDISTATQKYGSVLSSGINLVTEVLSNKDYFGRAIYKDTDSPTIKGQKIAQYMGLAFTHPFISETVKYFQNGRPLYQTLTIMAELPIKYSNITKAEQSRYYEALDKIKQTRSDYKSIIDLEAENRKLVKAGKSMEAASRVDALTPDEYEVYKAVKMIPTVKKTQTLVADGKQAEAQKIVDGLSSDEYKLYQFAKDNLATPAKPESMKTDKPSFPDNTKTSETSLIKDIFTYAKAIGTDPVTAFDRIFSGQKIRRTDSGAIIVERMSFIESSAVRKARGATPIMKLDHTIPLELGGSNAENNLKLVPEEDWKSYSPIENYLGGLLQKGKINKKTAQDLIMQFKNKTLTADEVRAKAKI